MELKILNKEEFTDYIPSLNRLFEKAFNRDIHPNFFEWRYLRNPNDDFLVAVAILDDEIVANYSVSSVMLKWNNETYKTALSMTTMTHPEHNGKGLFIKLANMLYEEMKRREYSAVWGFPNIKSHGAFTRKLGWSDIYEIPTFSLTIEGSRKIEVTNKFSIAEDDNFELLNIVNNYFTNKIKVKKNKDYCQWRYSNHPSNKYKNLALISDGVAIGNITYKVYNNTIDIVELQCVESDGKEYLIDYLINLCIDNNWDSLSCWLNLFDDSHTMLEKKGFINTTPITYFALKQIIPNSITTNYKDWYLQMGDSDVY